MALELTEVDRPTAVHLISDDWMAYIAQVNAKLMSSARLGIKFNQSEAGPALADVFHPLLYLVFG